MGKEKKHKEYKPDKREKYEEVPVSRPVGLKLVLKVGGSPVPECSEPRAETPPAPAPAVAPLRLNMAAISEAETQHKERKHKKKKKKEKEKHKHKKERRQLEELDYDQEMSPGPETGRESRQSSGTEEAPSQGTISSPEPCRTVSPQAGPATSDSPQAGPATSDPEPPEQETEPADVDKEECPPLRRFLEHLLRGLQEKDTRGFFSVPVTDDVAPGYSSIIDTPMDFSTIGQKVRDGQYVGLATFKEDFRLMCCNAMTYNRMDTIYYRTAKRLLHIGSKIMSSDKVIALRSVLPYMATLSPEVLGVEAADLMDQEEQQQHQEQLQQQQEPVYKMDVDSDVPAQPAEAVVTAETPPPPEVKSETPPAPEVKSEPAEEHLVSSAEEEMPAPEPMAVDPPPLPAAAVRQTRRQTRGAGETPQPPQPEPEPTESRPTRHTRGAERSEPEPEPEPTESRPTRHTRGAERSEPEPEPEPIESRPTRHTRGAERTEPESEQEPIESRPTRHTRGAERSEPEPEPTESRPTRHTRGAERSEPEPEPIESRPTRHTRGAERTEPEPEPETRQTRQGRLVEPKPEPAESRQTRQVRGQEQSKPESEGRQTRQARATEPQARPTEPQARATEPQARATEPQARATEPQARATEPQVRATEPKARVTEPQGRATEPQVRATEPQVRATKPQVRATEPQEPEPEGRLTRQARASEPQARVADPQEPEPETRQTRRGAAESQKAAVSDSPPPQQPGPAESDEPEAMDTSETTEPIASILIMKQPHLVLEKIDAELGMKLRRGSSRLVRAASNEETTAAPSATSQFPEQQQEEQARPNKTAAETARPQSTQKPAPSGKLGFLRQRVDGTTSLAIVTGAGGGERHERVATLGGLTGRVQQGIPHLPTFRDDKRNQAKPVKPLYYGAYSSFAPSHDSTFATISHDESELLFETLAGGPNTGQLAHSVRQAADDCDIAIDMVDSLLDVLTAGQHRRQEQRHRLADQALAGAGYAGSPAPAPAAPTASSAPAAPAAPATVDFASLRSLGDLGIDVGFLDGFEAEERRLRNTQTRLDQTSELLSSLNTAQLHRLSLPPEAVLPPPSLQELQLAEEVTSGLAELVKHVQPGQVAPQPAVRKAMGVGLLPPGQAPVVRPAAASAAAAAAAASSTPARPPPASVVSAPAHPSLRTLLSRV